MRQWNAILVWKYIARQKICSDLEHATTTTEVEDRGLPLYMYFYTTLNKIFSA